MKRIYYASGSVLTGDRMADAVVNYAEQLAKSEGSATVDIPVSFGGGREARAQLLIGPASQLVVVPEPSAVDVDEDEDTIADLRERASLLSPPHPQASEHAGSGFASGEYDADGEQFMDAVFEENL